MGSVVVLAVAAACSFGCRSDDRGASTDGPVGQDAATSPVDAPIDAFEPPVTEIGTVEQASDRVIVFKADADWSQTSSIVWSWQPSDSPQIPTAARAWFALLSDVKLRNHGTSAIVAASRGGVAIITIATKKVTFYAQPGGNTHSVELLPDGNLASISSTGGFVKLYCTDPGSTVVKTYPIADGHGVLWDPVHERLWALGGTQLIAYRYGGTHSDPALTIEATYATPTAGGHELFPVPNQPELFVSTGSHVYQFDTEARTFAPFTLDLPAIKSFSENPVSGQIVLMTPTTSWWSDTVVFHRPAATRVMPNARFYKARWWSEIPGW
ncbi:MAG: DUF6528 family protein [Kofleriaceae bacterium]